jgi:hypothetical protein
LRYIHASEYYFRSSLINFDNPLEKLSKRKNPRKPRANQTVSNFDESTPDVEEGITGRVVVDFVKEFCTQLIDDGAYNKLMGTTRDLVDLIATRFYFTLLLMRWSIIGFFCGTIAYTQILRHLLLLVGTVHNGILPCSEIQV